MSNPISSPISNPMSKLASISSICSAIITLAIIISAILFSVSCDAEKNSKQKNNTLVAGFENPADEYRPWCYWFWLNGHVDKKTADKDLEAIKKLGFGGILIVDPRGYWDDDDHVKMAAPEIEFMSEEWLDNVCYAIKKADKLGLQVTMNLSSCGGSFKGPWDLREDSPKRLMHQPVHLQGGTRLEFFMANPGLPYYKDVAVWAVRHKEKLLFEGLWKMSGDGSYDMSATSGRKMDGDTEDTSIKALEAIDLTDKVVGEKLVWDVPEGNWTLLRFGSCTISGFEHDVDILDSCAVRRHIERIVEPIKQRVPDLLGKTLTHFYSVSWEGSVPTWSPRFEEDFQKFTGKQLRPLMPMLAGFEMGEDGARERFMQEYRKARNDMFRVNFYGTMRRMCHAYGVRMYSECGGPWVRSSEVLREADQQEFLSLNDMPQGEFWCEMPGTRMMTRGISAASHSYGLKRSSVEAFTHMTYHWSMYPDTLKLYADQVFLDGINHFVWHTFTCSPDKFGVPGGEYFAGTHINRNVTWFNDARPFVDYLARCQYMLQQGLPVVDIAVWGGNRVYQHWGHYREKPYDSSSLSIPQGYNYDLINTEVLLGRCKAENGRIVLPDGMSYAVLILNPEFDDCLTEEVKTKIEELKSAGVKVLEDASQLGMLPDFEGELTAVHRKCGNKDIYFVAGEGRKDMIFRASGDVQLWDAVSGSTVEAESEALPDGRTKVTLDLPRHGSVFVVFNAGVPSDKHLKLCDLCSVDGPWEVSFKYHKLKATPPSSRVWTRLENLADDTDSDVAHFSGTLSLKCRFNSDEVCDKKPYIISLGNVIGGLAHVYVNGKDCGTVWTSPWEADVSGALRKGENTLEIAFTNTWQNLLIDDCARPVEERVTTSGLHYFQGGRHNVPGKGMVPTVYSGYTSEDPLQDNGVLGPVVLKSL